MRANPGAAPQRAARSILLGLGLLLGLAHTASGQHGADVGQAPPPPPGPGQLTVQIVAEDEGVTVEGLPIALYALAPDGTPGLANGTTDAAGRAEFAGISNDPGIVYLVGARFGEIPFGERVAFAEGSTEANVVIGVSVPIDRVEGVTVEEIRTRVDWMGDRVVVTEIIRLASAGGRVIRLPADPARTAIFERKLPATARDFDPGPSSIGDDLALEDERIRFYGPLYPGEQRVEYRFSLPVDRDRRTLRLPIELSEAAGRVVVVAGTAGIDVSGADLVAARDLSPEKGPPLSSWARGALAADQRIEVGLALPESRVDPTALTLPRADVWLDLDDTRLEANVELKLLVDPGAPLSGTPDAPLLHVSVPFGAELQGVAPEAEAMGLVPTSDGGFDVIGPIGPGEHALGFSYRMASRPDGVALDMRFPREVETLNVLVADTGVALESTRLHRRRPFRNRTRNFLHREAYNVGMDEVVDLTLAPLRATGLPQQASMALILVAAGVGAWFLVTPLRSGSDPASAGLEDERLREEREAVYVAITDLDHDFETGKLDDADYAAMRTELRAQAVALMREERQVARAQGAAARVDEPATTRVAPPARAAAGPRLGPADADTPAVTGRFCPSCGERVDPAWRFCSHCGGGLRPAPGAGAEG